MDGLLFVRFVIVNVKGDNMNAEDLWITLDNLKASGVDLSTLDVTILGAYGSTGDLDAVEFTEGTLYLESDICSG